MQRSALLMLGVALFLATHLLPSAAVAQSTPPLCDADSAYRKLDFWVGEWDVLDAQQRKVGTNSIQKILGGCAVLENWVDANGGEGKSWFYYSKVAKRWNQVWVVGRTGAVKEKHLIAELAGGGLRFQGEVLGRDGIWVLDRTTLTPLPNERVRQVIEVSKDGGNTWTVGFDALYVRAKR